MFKKGQERVSRMDSPRQGEKVNPEEGKIKHKGGSQSQTRTRLVPKRDVDYQLWNALIGVDNPERLGFADDGATTAGGRRS